MLLNCGVGEDSWECKEIQPVHLKGNQSWIFIGRTDAEAETPITLATGCKVSEVTQSCPTLCDPMVCSMPAFPIHHQLLELTQTQVHWVSDAIQLSHPLVVPFSSCLQSFPASGSFQISKFLGASLVARRLKCLPAMWETWVRSLGREDPLEKEMATHCSILAWRIPWTEEPGRLQSMGVQRVGHDWATQLNF